MSARTFTRRLRTEVGQSPHEWVVQRRVDHARQLLESTELSIMEVARAAGFADPCSYESTCGTPSGSRPTPTVGRTQPPDPPPPCARTSDGGNNTRSSQPPRLNSRPNSPVSKRR
ncbi:helix-turn-helix domain-containing protein [Streptomyces mirabilis]